MAEADGEKQSPMRKAQWKRTKRSTCNRCDRYRWTRKNAAPAAVLVPKLLLGNALDAKLCFAASITCGTEWNMQGWFSEAELRGSAFPSRSLGTRVVRE